MQLTGSGAVAALAPVVDAIISRKLDAGLAAAQASQIALQSAVYTLISTAMDKVGVFAMVIPCVTASDRCTNAKKAS